MAAKHLPPAAGFMGVRIQVTATDIRLGCQAVHDSETPYVSRACPLARAINRHLAPGWFSGIGDATAVIHERDGARKFPVQLPSVAETFVADVDGKRPVEPFGFYLPLPLAALKASTGVKS